MRRRREPVVQEEVWELELRGGAQLWVCPRPARRCHALLCVDFGALDEAAGTTADVLPEGIAHFLEHRLFEKPEGDISERFTDLGADVDAQTGLTNTSFACTAGPAVFPAALDLLLELVGCAHFPADSVERERSIITREIRLFEDSVEWVAFQTALASLYRGRRIAVDIAGTERSLARIDAPLLRRCHEAFYRAGRLQLFVAGPVDPEGVGAQVDRVLAGWPHREARSTRRPWNPAHPEAQEAKLGVSRPRRVLAFAARAGAAGLDLLREELALELALDILFGPASEFYARQYESGLIDDETFGGEVHADESFCFCLLGGDTDDPEALSSAVNDELIRAADSDWIERDFARAFRRAYGEMVSRWEEVDGCTAFMEDAALRGCHPFELVELYTRDGAVGPGDVRGCLDRCLRAHTHATATVWPG